MKKWRMSRRPARAARARSRARPGRGCRGRCRRHRGSRWRPTSWPARSPTARAGVSHAGPGAPQCIREQQTRPGDYRGAAMWVGSMRVGVWTADQPDAGTDSLVQAEVLRDDAWIATLNLDYATEDDLERGAFRDYVYFSLPRRNDQTPPLPDGVGQNPMPYPDFGFEYSHGLFGHLKLRLHIRSDDMWIKDKVDLSIRQVREVATSFDTLAWQQDSSWSVVGVWGQDVAMSTDDDEGVETWTLLL